MRGAGLLSWQDGGEVFAPTPGGLLDGLPDMAPVSSLHMFLEPEDIATIPGLPQQVYDEAARNKGGLGRSEGVEARPMASTVADNQSTGAASAAALADESLPEAAHDRSWDALSRYAQSAVAHDAAVNASGSSADIRLQDPWIDIPQRHWSAKDSSVSLSPEMEGKVGPVAQQFYDITARDLVVTDGRRTAADQAQRMYDKFAKGDNTTYVGPSGRAIRSIYDAGMAAGTDKATIQNKMSAKISEQMTNGHPVSRHLENQAVDFQDMYLTPQQRGILGGIIRDNAGISLPEGIPRHMHASFPPPRK
jgi:hypothetical protein